MEHSHTIGPDDFAKLLKVSRAKFFRLKSSGRLPQHLQFGRVVRWVFAEVDAWLRAGAPPRDEWDDMKGDLGFPPGGK